MRLEKQIENIARGAKEASRKLATISSKKRNQAIMAMAMSLRKNRKSIIKANVKDLTAAKRRGLSVALIDRLTLNEKRIDQMSASLKSVASLKDPLGRTLSLRKRPNGLTIKKVSVPIGVVAIIYESRPNVTSDCAGLCLKSGNAVILRGGRESIHSNIAIYIALKSVLKKYGIAQGAISLVKSVDRKAVDVLLGLYQQIDVVIPRGGESLLKLVTEKSKIPVIKHYKGVCHTYVDSEANLTIARKIAFNAKVQRPGVCNAMETLLVHRKVARKFLSPMLEDFKRAGVEIRADQAVRKLTGGIKKANEADWSTEYLDLVLSVKVVSSLEEAITHINCYGSGHSDAIITRNKTKARKFLRSVDSACVYLNTSTRFTDGFEFGMGAEMGISTDKLHARGPMALEELTTYKYEVVGNGQIRT